MSDFTSPINVSLSKSTSVDRDLKSDFRPAGGINANDDARSFARDYSMANDRQRARHAGADTSTQTSSDEPSGHKARSNTTSESGTDTGPSRKSADASSENPVAKPGESETANSTSAGTSTNTELDSSNSEKRSPLDSRWLAGINSSDEGVIANSGNNDTTEQGGARLLSNALAGQPELTAGADRLLADTDGRHLLEQSAQADLANALPSSDGSDVTSSLVGLEAAGLSTTRNNIGVFDDAVAKSAISATNTGLLINSGNALVAAGTDTAADETLLAGIPQNAAPATSSLVGLKVGETITSTAMASHFKQLAANSNGTGATAKGSAATELAGDDAFDAMSSLRARPVTTLTGAASVVTQSAGIATAVGIANSASASDSAMRGNRTGLLLDVAAVSPAGEFEMSASQLQAGQMTALSARNASTSMIAPPALIAEENMTLLNSELSAGGGNTPKNVALADGSNPLIASGSAGVANSLADNMLAGSASGTVTAPVLARTDLVSTQLVSAPSTVPLMLPAASEAMTSNISWMVKEGVQNASVSVAPAGMGPISVNIGIEKEQMNVSIVATQGTTREALEALLPRLREQLTAQGHDSVRVDISDGKSDQARGNNPQNQQQSQSFERQNFGGEQSSGNNAERSSDQGDQNEKSGSEHVSATNGERQLTEAERARLEVLSGAFPQSESGIATVQHGYDLYV